MQRISGMRAAVLCLLSACAAWPQFRSTVPLVVAPTTVKDSKGKIVDGLSSQAKLPDVVQRVPPRRYSS